MPLSEKTCGLWLFLLSAENVDDCTEAVPLLKLLPDLKDCDILADKAYGTKEIRTYLHDQFARYTIQSSRGRLIKRRINGGM